MKSSFDASTGQNYYDSLFARATENGQSVEVALEPVAGTYLDGKPKKLGQRNLTKKERDKLFWSSSMVKECSPGAWTTEVMILALTRYLGQEALAAEGLVARVAQAAPEALIRAARYSGLVLNHQSPRRAELQEASKDCPAVAELCRVFDIFDLAHHERVTALEKSKLQLSDLSVFEFLIYASLYAFEHLVNRDVTAMQTAAVDDQGIQVAWDAIGDLLVWKLETASASSLKLTEDSIGQSVARYLRPLLFEPSHHIASDAAQNLQAFHALLDAQIELNEFVGRSANAFSYDDGIRFVRVGVGLEIVEVNPVARCAWQEESRKLNRLHGYWFHRALNQFVEYVKEDPSRWAMGRPESADANRLAWIRALQAQLRLREVYGVADEVATQSGEAVNLFQALLSLNLMSVFFQRDFLVAFSDRLRSNGNWLGALCQLAMDGLRNEFQNRLPITWSSRDAKIASITGWKVTESQRKGSSRMAAAILDFWSYDLVDIAGRLQRREPGLVPQLFERPVLKFGATYVQLPWIVGMQNNSTAAINGLRRLGARRGQIQDETQRIEAGLARLLESRGFSVLLNWEPPRNADLADPGEVDVIAARDDHLFIFEVKSTFIRRSQRDAWLHATTTLRNAGLQLRRKVEAVSSAIESDPTFRMALGWNEVPTRCRYLGWIVDTSIECDHQHFSGFLKISFEEILIALRDERHLLKDASALLTEQSEATGLVDNARTSSATTMYPRGFDAGRFVEVIEAGAVWDETGRVE